MVRLKYSAIVKLVALFFFGLFIVPSLLKLFNGPSAPLDESGERLLGVKNNEYGAVAVDDESRQQAAKNSGYDRTSWREVNQPSYFPI